jgi:hypothetical protein
MSAIQSVREVAASAGFSAVYELTCADGTISCVPMDTNNRDYVAIQAWIAAGGTLT